MITLLILVRDTKNQATWKSEYKIQPYPCGTVLSKQTDMWLSDMIPHNKQIRFKETDLGLLKATIGMSAGSGAKPIGNRLLALYRFHLRNLS